MDRDRLTERGALSHPGPERRDDVAGDTMAPVDQDILVGGTFAETMPSQALTDAREISPDAATRLAADTTARPEESVNMAGRPLDPVANVAGDVASRAETLFGQIREGMKVVDAAGKELGKVDWVSAGDPEAATTEGQEMRDTTMGVIPALGGALIDRQGEPDVPEPFRSQLIREGFVKVDGKGWFGKDYYLMIEQIDQVVGDEVRLAVTGDQVAKA